VNVLFVVHQFLPRHAAGTEIYTYHLMKELQRRGHEVTLFTTEFYGDRAQYELERKDYDGLPVWEAVHNHYFPSFEHSYVDPDMERLFEQVLAEVQPELVHFQHLHLHSLGYVDIAKRHGLPIVYTLHEYILMCLRGGQLLRPNFEICEGPDLAKCAECATMYPEPGQPPVPPPSKAEMLVKSKLPGPLRKVAGKLRGMLGGKSAAPAPQEQAAGDVEPKKPSYRDAVEARLRFIKERMAKVDLFVSPSEFLRQRFIANGFIKPERILFSDNGFFVEPFANVQRHERIPGKLRVGFVGTIAEYKGVHLIVEAFQGIDDPDISCEIWGDLKTFPDYEQRLLGMDKPDTLEFKGRFDNSKIAEVLAKFDVLIVPSLWFENSPLTIHEAYLAGIPVLTADRGGMAELVEPDVTGLHFKMGDSADMREQILRLHREEGLLERLSQRFPHIKTIAEDTELVEGRYRSLLDGKLPTV
jgi:glycosyltransferase involved in cell wall biosynthesis